MIRHKHVGNMRRGAWQHVYQGRELLAVIEQRADRHWHAIVAGRVGACATLRLVDAIVKPGSGGGAAESS
jgi:hypothetical protein